MQQQSRWLHECLLLTRAEGALRECGLVLQGCAPGWAAPAAGKAERAGAAQEAQHKGRKAARRAEAAHHLALQCGIFMAVWIAAVGTRRRLMSSHIIGP